MDTLHALRSVLTQPTTIGFGAADLIELIWVVLLVSLTCAWRPWIVPAIDRS